MDIIKSLYERIFEPWGRWEMVECNVQGTVTYHNILTGEVWPPQSARWDVYKRVHKFSGKVQYRKAVR